MVNRCQTVAGLRGRWLPGADRDLWALVVYAIAGECARAPGDVSAAQVRYRLEDEAYPIWLCAALQRLGHHVHAPDPVAPVPGLLGSREAANAVSAEAVAARLAVLRANQAPTADDPVAAVWRAGSVEIAGTAEMTDGTLVGYPPRSRLGDARRMLVELVDETLVAERGGWPAGTPVRTGGVGEHITGDGWLAGEYGVAPDRAWVVAPAWTLDHARHTLAAGPHTGRHAVHRTYFHRVAPGIETTSWYEETGTLVHIIWYLESQTSHRIAALPHWAQENMRALAGDNQDPEYLARIEHLIRTEPDAPRWILVDDGYFELL